jgi:hypothetical protein
MATVRKKREKLLDRDNTGDNERKNCLKDARHEPAAPPDENPT